MTSYTLAPPLPISGRTSRDILARVCTETLLELHENHSVSEIAGLLGPKLNAIETERFKKAICGRFQKIGHPARKPAILSTDLQGDFDSGLHQAQIARRHGVSVQTVREATVELCGSSVRRMPIADVVRIFYDKQVSGRKFLTLVGLIDKDLEACRLDAAFEARWSIADRVICRVCGEFRVQMGGKNGHLRSAHPQVSTEEYHRLYPGALLRDIANTAKSNSADVQQVMKNRAELYVTHEQLKDCREDTKREEGQKIKDYVVCRICGMKIYSFLGDGEDGHLCTHILTIGPEGVSFFTWADYQEKYAGAPRSSEKHRKKVRDANSEMYSRAWRPEGWWTKPGDWRAIGTELLSKDYMTNEELAQRLDDMRIVKCPYGSSWGRVLTTGAGKKRIAVNFISDIRAWVNRPGKPAKSVTPPSS